MVSLPAGRLILLPLVEAHRYGQLVLGQDRPLIRLSTGSEAGRCAKRRGVELGACILPLHWGAGPDHATPNWWAS